MGCQQSNIETIKNKKKPNIQRKIVYNIVYENLKIQKQKIQVETEHIEQNFNETFITLEFPDTLIDISSTIDWMKEKEMDFKIKEFEKIKEIVNSHKTLERIIFLQKMKIPDPYETNRNKAENFSQRDNLLEIHHIKFSNIINEQILINIVDNNELNFTLGEIKNKPIADEGLKSIEELIVFWENIFFLKLLQKNPDVENNVTFDYQNAVERIQISHKINDLDYFAELIQAINQYKCNLHIQTDLNEVLNFFSFMRNLRIMNFSINLQIECSKKLADGFELSISIEKYANIDILNTLIRKKNENLINLMKFFEENKFFIRKIEYSISKENKMLISLEGFNYLDITAENYCFKSNFISFHLDNENIISVSWKEGDPKEAKEITFLDLQFTQAELFISKTMVSEKYNLTVSN